MTFDEICLKHGADKASSHHAYTKIYENYFGPIRDQPITGVEIGYQFGCGLKSLAEYFHNGDIYGVDIADGFKTDNPHIHLFQGNQSDRSFWSKWMPGLMLDWAIDDASHLASDQSVCFECLWPRMKPKSLYVLEDCWTWPDPLWKQQPQASSFLTQLVWWLNKSGKQYYGRPGAASEPLNAMESSIEFIHFYPGLAIIKKR